jgi:hypothetical protein
MSPDQPGVSPLFSGTERCVPSADSLSWIDEAAPLIATAAAGAPSEPVRDTAATLSASGPDRAEQCSP